MRLRVIYALVALLVSLAINQRAHAQNQSNRRLANVVVTNNNSGSGNCPVTTGNNTATWQSCGGGGSGSPGGSTNSIQYKVNGTTFGGISVADAQLLLGQTGSFPAAVTMSGDCTIADTGAITCLDTNGIAFTSQAFGTSLNLSVPPAIGGTTPAAGSFTNLSSSGTVSGTGFTNYLASPPAIGGTAAAAGNFTNLSTLQIANASSTGTTTNKLAKLTGAPSTAVITATTDTNGAVGIVSSGAGTAGTAIIRTAGNVACVFDGATTAGHYVQISSSVAGDCTDAGSTYPNSNEVIGQVLSTNGSGGTYNVALQLIQAGVAVTGPGGSNTQAQFNNSGSFAGATNLTINNSTGNVSKITSLGPTSITGNQANGTDQVSNVNVNQVFNVRAYGAVGDGSHDDAPAFQAAIDAACSYDSNFNPTIPTVYFPTPGPGHVGGFPAVYKLGSPLFFHCNNLHIQGPSATNTNHGFLEPTFGGWPFVISQLTYGGGTAVSGVDLDTPIITSSTHSALFDQTNNNIMVNYGADMGGFNQVVNGLTQFDEDTYVKLSATTNGNIFSSSGELNRGATQTTAYQLYLNSDHVCARFNTTGQGAINICGSDAVTTGAVHDLYASADLVDGHCRVMLDGKLEAVTVCTGTLIQQPWELQVAGYQTINDSPDGIDNKNLGPAIGDWDGMILSKEIRHSTASTTVGATIYTPTNAEPTTDSNTLIYMSFDTNSNMLTQVTGINQAFTGAVSWLYPRRADTQPDGSNQLSDVTVFGLQLTNFSEVAFGSDNSNGIIGWGVVDALFDNVSLQFVNYGIDLAGASFANAFRNVFIENAGLAGMHIGIASTENTIWNGVVTGGIFQFTALSGGTFTNIHVQENNSTIWGFGFLPNDDNYVNLNCIGCEDDDEGTVNAFQMAVLLDGTPSATFVGGSFGLTDQTTGSVVKPAMFLNNVGKVHIDGTYFYNHATTSNQSQELIHVSGAPTEPVILTNVRQQNIIDADAWSSTLQYFNFPGCGGWSTLDGSGNGTIKAQCITAASNCRGNDITNQAHTFTLSAPSITGSPLNGTVTISSGTASDVVRVMCE